MLSRGTRPTGHSRRRPAASRHTFAGAFFLALRPRRPALAQDLGQVGQKVLGWESWKTLVFI
jgi:hypothetical protein